MKDGGGGVVYLQLLWCTKQILNCDENRHLSEAVRVPMNHTALSPLTPTLLYLLFMSSSGTNCVSLSLSVSLLVSPLSHVPGSKRYQQCWVCCRKINCICHLFSLLYTVAATCCFISCCAFVLLSVPQPCNVQSM